VDLASLGKLDEKQENLISLLRVLPTCTAHVQVRGGLPVGIDVLGTRIVADIKLTVVTDPRAVEVGLLGACQELVYGVLEIKVTDGTVVGWEILKGSYKLD